MNLPLPIQAYFDADKNGDGDALARAFASDAVVTDEGHSHGGRSAIAAWWRDAKARYRHVAEPLEATGQDGVTKVRARVSGSFQGSPAILTFAFRLDGDRIVELTIGA